MKVYLPKLLFIVCFIAAISPPSHAQPRDHNWSIGPELGANFSKFGMNATETDYITGLILGGFLTYSAHNTYAFTGKVLYSQKGARDDNSNTTTQLNYVEVPVLARVFFNRRGVVRPNIFAGPSLGFLQGAKGKVGSGDYEKIPDYQDSFKTFDLGVGIGFGLNIKMDDAMHIIVDTRYTYGVNDVTSSPAYVNNQAIAISAGLSFGIRQRIPCRTHLWN